MAKGPQATAPILDSTNSEVGVATVEWVYIRNCNDGQPRFGIFDGIAAIERFTVGCRIAIMPADHDRSACTTHLIRE